MYLNNKVYIIKPYNQFLPSQKEETIIKKFSLYDNKYCISEVVLEWGQPVVARPLQQQDRFGYFIYNTYQEAQEYIKKLKHLANN